MSPNQTSFRMLTRKWTFKYPFATECSKIMLIADYNVAKFYQRKSSKPCYEKIEIADNTQKSCKGVFLRCLVNLGKLVYNFSENCIFFHNRVCSIPFDKFCDIVIVFRD